MRLAAFCLATLLLMQASAKASIVSSLSGDLQGVSTAWYSAFDYFAWERTHHVLRFGQDDEDPSQLTAGTSASTAFAASLTGADSLQDAYGSASGTDEEYYHNIRIAGTSVAPEPATLSIWGFSALALAAATYRRQKRAGRTNGRVKAAVSEYLAACSGPSEHFRLLGSYLTTLADDPAWSKQDVEAFYDEVVVALHRRREHSEVA